MTIAKEDRNIEFLKSTVSKIFESLRHVEKVMSTQFPNQIKALLPEKITFVHSEELESRFPNLTPK